MDDHFFNMRKDNFDEENAGSMVKGSDALSRSADDDLQHTQKKRKVEQGPEMNSLEVYKKFASEEAILCPFEALDGPHAFTVLSLGAVLPDIPGYHNYDHIPHWLQGSSLLP
mmetsp:Transcript_16093/g.53955  ORF Transcript_16093/g.53955 Transcript_16093/m.53955 type:complete len:112 (-) Transcript_16093:1522-1857(-)